MFILMSGRPFAMQMYEKYFRDMVGLEKIFEFAAGDASHQKDSLLLFLFYFRNFDMSQWRREREREREEISKQKPSENPLRLTDERAQ
jgi:hypothetical protein